jgi:hypothetical protein
MRVSSLVRATALASGVLLALAGNVHASGWSRPAVVDPGCPGKSRASECVLEPAPRAAVDALGETVATWVDPRGRVRAAIGDAHGRFGRAVALAKGLRPAVSIAADGAAVVVWNGRDDGLWYARARRGRRFGRPAALTPAKRRFRDDFPHAAGQPDGSTVILYDREHGSVDDLRAVTLPRVGNAGPVTDLGDGFIDHDSFRAAANGQAAVCCLDDPSSRDAERNRVAVYIPGRGWSRWTAPRRGQERLETVGVGAGDVAIGTIDVREDGDALTLGAPGVLRANGTGAFGALLPAPVVKPTRSFGPVVAIDGSGRNVLVYQEKRKPQAFSELAPVYAAVGSPTARLRSRQVLATSQSYHPTVRPYGDGAIAAWEAPRNRWGVAVEHAGRFQRVSAPTSGPSLLGEDFVYNRDLETAGRYAVLAWTAPDATIRVSVGTLGAG